jgi:hypothetical protein
MMTSTLWGKIKAVLLETFVFLALFLSSSSMAIRWEDEIDTLYDIDSFITIGFLFFLSLLLSNSISFFFLRENRNLRTIDEHSKQLGKYEEFLKKQISLLPKDEAGQNDVSGIDGLSHIPFLLTNIEERRNRFQKTSDSFLKMMISVGLILSTILTFFTYVLLSDESFGPSKVLGELVSVTEKSLVELGPVTPLEEDWNLKKILAGYKGDYPDVPEKYSISSLTIEALIREGVSLKLLDSLKEIKDFEYSKLDDFEKKINSLQNITITTLDKNLVIDYASFGAKSLKFDEEDVDDLDSLEKYFDALEKHMNFNLKSWDGYFAYFVDSRHTALKWYITERRSESYFRNYIRKLDKLAEVAEERLEKDDIQISEFLKRLSLGIIISTFFLTIMKFFGNLYNEHHRQVLLAELDDLKIRRFYVSFKSSKDDAEPGQKSGIIKSFMESEPSVEGGAGTTKNDIPSNTKELLSTIIKKL